MLYHLVVGPLPSWMPLTRLLGDRGWKPSHRSGYVEAELKGPAAADVVTRLRKQGFDGHPLDVSVTPKLSRPLIRAARTRDAHARRKGSPGFQRPGCKLDEEGRFSLTPEALALRMGKSAGGRTVLDVCCGAGGNTIGFARAGSKVIAVDRSLPRLQMARHNAEVYDVRQQITFVKGDGRKALRQFDADIVFVDPPWGGSYDTTNISADDLPLVREVWQSARNKGIEAWAKLPPSFDPNTLVHTEVVPVFGVGDGDKHKVKFLWVKLTP